MFNNWYEDAMNNSKDEEILEDGWTKHMRLTNFIDEEMRCAYKMLALK